MNNHESPEVTGDSLESDATTPAEGTSDASSSRRRRRRSSQRFGLALLFKHNSRVGGRSGGRGRGRSAKRDFERFVLISCLVLSLVVAVFVGFLAGKNSAASAKLSERPQKYEEVVATPETESLLEAGFVHLNGGDFRKAFLDFQKALQGQPSLPGIDYLVGYSALHSGEYSLAKDALDHAVSKNEMEGESRVLLALISLDESTNEKNASTQMTDPLVTAESEFRRYASTHPKSAWIYSRWAEIHRQRGSYRTAADLLHKAVLRADPDENLSLLAAREVLNKLQNQPAKEAPPIATITSMRGDEALGAALAALQNKSSSDAVLFLERAKEFYSPRVFREIASDKAFDEYRADARVIKILEGTSMKSAQP